MRALRFGLASLWATPTGLLGGSSMAARLYMLKRGATPLVCCCMPLQFALGPQMAYAEVEAAHQACPHQGGPQEAMPRRTKTIAKKNVSTTKKTGKRCSKASPHCGKEFVLKRVAWPRCEDDDTFCYCAGCVPATPAYFDESSDDEEEISPLYHERLRVQEEFLAEQFDDDRLPI